MSRHEDGFVGHDDTVAVLRRTARYRGRVNKALYKRIQVLGRDNRYFL